MDWLLIQAQIPLGLGNLTVSLTDNVDSALPNVSPWLTPELRIIVLGTIVPASVVAWTLLYDFFCAIRFPKVIRVIVQLLRSPFEDFLHIEDLEEQPGELRIPPAWKSRIWVTLSCFEAIGWAALFAYDEFVGAGRAESMQAGVGFITWVSAFLGHERRFPQFDMSHYFTSAVVCIPQGSLKTAIVTSVSPHSVLFNGDARGRHRLVRLVRFGEQELRTGCRNIAPAGCANIPSLASRYIALRTHPSCEKCSHRIRCKLYAIGIYPCGCRVCC